jgi:hypothetical protein
VLLPAGLPGKDRPLQQQQQQQQDVRCDLRVVACWVAWAPAKQQKQDPRCVADSWVYNMQSQPADLPPAVGLLLLVEHCDCSPVTVATQFVTVETHFLSARLEFMACSLSYRA